MNDDIRALRAMEKWFEANGKIMLAEELHRIADNMEFLYNTLKHYAPIDIENDMKVRGSNPLTSKGLLP